MKDEIFLSKKQEYISIELMTWNQIEEVMQLRESMYEGGVDSQLFAKAEREDFIKAMNDGFGLVGYAHGKIIACLLCTLEQVEYGVDRNYDKEKLSHCADYVDVFVNPKYRGNGIQNILEEIMIEICRKNGKNIILGTVAPDNQPSYQNFIKAGYQEVDRMKKYGGLDRIFMEKRLDEVM